MQTTRLGRTDIAVSRLCLGTMTWGSQNTEAEAHAQIDYALDAGINFLDTAEMYPTTPLARETAGRTEEIIGAWIAARRRRHDIVLATKITGEGSRTVRGGEAIGPRNLREALEGSLRRLGSDHVDLYQLHWPNRGSYHFRRYFAFRPELQAKDLDDDLLATLETLARFVEEGKVRAIGLSNETSWGTMRFLHLAETQGLPRVATIQNEWSLLCRTFDTDLAEIAHHEDVGLLAFSPLAAGLLTGKYAGGARPPGSRAALNDTLNGRINRYSEPVAAEYVALAARHGLHPAHLAIGFALTRPFMAAAIIGATTMEQLRTDIAAADVRLGEDVVAGIEAIRRAHPVPM